MKSHLPKPLAAPQFSPGTFSMSKAQPPTLSQWGGGERCISAFSPGPRWTLVQTLSSCRPAHIGVLMAQEQLLTCMSALRCLHISHTSARALICTHLIQVFLMYMSYTLPQVCLLTHVLHMLIFSHIRLHTICLLTYSTCEPSFILSAVG